MTKSHRRSKFEKAVVACIAATTFGVAQAAADITVVTLHPVDSVWSQAHGIDPVTGQVFGKAAYGAPFSADRATLWINHTSSIVDLNPLGALNSNCFGAHGGQQIGRAALGSGFHAILWSGTAESFVDLHPAGTSRSEAFAITDGQQGGYVRHGAPARDRAAIWSGTPESWVDLHPTGATQSAVFAVGDGRQGGSAHFNFAPHAGLWNGTASSWIDLHPEGAEESEVSTIEGPLTGGNVWYDGISHAGFWTGDTVESWVDLHPVGSGFSVLIDIEGGYQVGFAEVDGSFRAVMWNGTPESLFNLSSFLPNQNGGWGESFATGISIDDGIITVSGYAFSGDEDTMIAVIWTIVTDPCLADTNGDGDLSPADFSAWIAAFNAMSPACDQNGDMACTPADFSAWVANFNAGCN